MIIGRGARRGLDGRNRHEAARGRLWALRSRYSVTLSRDMINVILGTLKKASAAAFSGYWLGPPLIRPPSVPPFFLMLLRAARLRPAAAGSRRVGVRSGSQPSLHLPSTCARVPFAARLDARALRRSCARTPKSGQLVPSGAECGASACGLTPKELARGGGGGGDRSYLCSTQCVFAYPVGARAIGRVGARRFDAAGVSNAAPTGTVAN